MSIEVAREVIAAGERRWTWVQYAHLPEAQLERVVFDQLHGPRAALEEARGIVPATDAIRQGATSQREALERQTELLRREWNALKSVPPDPDSLERARHLPERIAALLEVKQALDQVLSRPWPNPEAVLRGVRAVGRVALRLDLEVMAPRLENSTYALWKAAGEALALVRGHEAERSATEAVAGVPLITVAWSQEDVAVLERVRSTAAIRQVTRSREAA